MEEDWLELENADDGEAAEDVTAVQIIQGKALMGVQIGRLTDAQKARAAGF